MHIFQVYLNTDGSVYFNKQLMQVITVTHNGRELFDILVPVYVEVVKSSNKNATALKWTISKKNGNSKSNW